MAIQPLINEKFNGDIWRLEIDEVTETLFVEVRNREERKVSFASVSLQTGAIYFSDVAEPMPWSTGMEAAHKGVLLLHNYQSENSPVHKGLTAIDGVSGKTLWSNFNYAFDHLSVNGPVVYDARMQGRKLFIINVENGSSKAEYVPSGHEMLINRIKLPSTVPVEPLNLSFLTERPFSGMVDYLEFNNFKILSLHAVKAELLSQFLYIFEGDNNLYEDLLTQSIQKMQPESFMMHKNRLIYIKNKTGLKVLSL